MLPKWLMALLVLLQEAWSTRRDAHIRFLKLRVEMLQARLPGNRVILDPVERRTGRTGGFTTTTRAMTPPTRRVASGPPGRALNRSAAGASDGVAAVDAWASGARRCSAGG